MFCTYCQKTKIVKLILLVNRIVLLFLLRFFIGYWILKTGLNFHSGPFLFLDAKTFENKKAPQTGALKKGTMIF
jgi:hypothetical protein